MLVTIALAFVAGFFLGNGLPYYTQGSTGDGRNPSPFPDSPVVGVFVACGAFAVAVISWAFVDVSRYELPAYLAALLGLLVVALIHTRTWRSPNVWGKRSARQED